MINVGPASFICLWVPFRRISAPVFIAAAAALLLLPSTGCGTALRISHRPVGSTANPVPIPGVPFYAKRARCRQEVVWFEPIYTLTLAALLPGKDGALQTHARGAVVLSRSSFESQEVIDFMKVLNNQPSEEVTVMNGWKKIVTRADPHVLSRDFASLGATDRILAGRSAAPAIYVDYADQYYVNAKIPVAGSANVDAKVAADGSLSEASGQVETKTLETILNALPISSLITGGLGLGGKSIADVGKVEAFQLTVSISGYRHTLARFVDYPSTSPPAVCPVAPDIALADATDYKREDISAAADTSSGDKKGNSKDSGDKKGNSKDSASGDQTNAPDKKP
jgi:hypothetical protein